MWSTQKDTFWNDENLLHDALTLTVNNAAQNGKWQNVTNLNWESSELNILREKS